MADGADQEDDEYPLWGRILMAPIAFGASLGIGWAFAGIGGAIMGGIIGLGLGLFAFLAPGVLAGILAVLEILGSCS